jgi:murein DD-endopeptidase MepM/ murein hydrolase activator NlpD
VLISAAFLGSGAPQQRPQARELPLPNSLEGDAGEPVAGSVWWWGAREDRLERGGNLVERQAALAHELTSRAAGDEARAQRRFREAVARHLTAARALLRLDEVKVSLAGGRATLARGLTAAAAVLRRQAGDGSAGSQASARARLLAAAVLRAEAEARLQELRLTGERAARARELRAAAAEVALRQVELDRAAARRSDREAAWRTVELAREERNRRRAALARQTRYLAGALAAADALALPAPATRRLDGASQPPVRVHKRDIALGHRLDRRLLRLLGEPFGPRSTGRRRQDPGSPAVDAGAHAQVAARGGGDRGAPTLWPIAGAPRGPDPTAPGLREAGFTILSAVPQTVSAPAAGTVAFAGPFRGFGLLLIIDRGGGYHALLAGFSRLDVRRGASVVAGQAVGEIAARGDEPAHLYLELRYRGSPIDPAPWLAAQEDKVRG